MRIALVGNMNNNMFVLKRYMEDLGYKDSTLFLLDEFEHFLPEKDTYDQGRIGDVVHIGWSEYDYWNLSKKAIQETFKDYDYFVGVNYAAAFLHKAGIKLNMFVASGSDVMFNPFYKFKHFPPKKWEFGLYFLSRSQRLGIKNSDYVWAAWKNEMFVSALERIRGENGKLIAVLPQFLYLPQYNDLDKEFYPRTELRDQLRKKYDYIFFHHAAHRWTRGVFKCNNWLIEAFANFLKNPERDKEVCLVLLEYGIDLEASKELIQKLGIGNHIYWLPQSTRKNIMLDIHHLCDFGFGQFGRSWMHYGVIMEYMAMEKPFCHHRDDELYVNDYDSLYPMANASSVDEIEKVMFNYISNPDKYSDMGPKGKVWLSHQYNDVSNKKLLELLNEADS